MTDKPEDKPGETVEPKPEETTPDPQSTPPTVTPPEETKDDLREVVETLVGRVDELTETVTGLADTGQDTSPVKPPWTHRRLF